MAKIIGSKTSKLKSIDTDEHELIPMPEIGQRHIVTMIRYLHNDTVTKKPKLRIKDISDAASERNSTSEEFEFHPLIPEGDGARSFAEGEFFELTAPVCILQNIPGIAEESIVIQEDVAVSDADNPASIIATWLIEEDS